MNAQAGLAADAVIDGVPQERHPACPAGLRRQRVALVINTPAPYRVPAFRLLAQEPDVDLRVIYCTRPYIDPSLDAESHGFEPLFLTAPYINMDRRFFHSDPRIWSRLSEIDPDVVITTGYVPTYLYAMAWVLFHRRAHIAMTDGTADSEARLSSLHRLARRVVLAFSRSCIGAGEGSRALFRKFGVPAERIHTAPLAVHNPAFECAPAHPVTDFLFCGRFVDHKGPSFALAVARACAKRLGRRVGIRMVGRGPLLAALKVQAAAMADEVDVEFRGYAAQGELPGLYASSRLFLFPTLWDPWGVVANEACASGLPVLVSPHAGVAGELVRDGETGRVLDLDVDTWTEAAVRLLNDERKRRQFGARARQAVARYSFRAAADGMAGAIRQAIRQPRVCIIQAVAKQYRAGFFQRLHERLARHGIELRVFYSAPNPQDALRRDSIELPPPYGVRVGSWWPLGERLLFQPVMREVLRADLVIVEQANKHAINYPLHLLRRLGIVRMAFWGHGRNWQAPDGIGEVFKRRMLKEVDWWFAYTRRVGDYLALAGYPRERTSVIDNSIDVSALSEAIAAIPADGRARILAGAGIPVDAEVGLYCGSLYPNKHLDLLFDACRLIRQRRPGFHLVVMGAGQLEDMVQATALAHDWVHYVGAHYGDSKADYFAVASLYLCPGLIGLGVLDAFAAGLPVVTTDTHVHSPEIAYLEHGSNGLIVHMDPSAYAEAVCAVLGDPDTLRAMGGAARDSAARLTLDHMVETFADGITRCLGAR